MDKPGSYIKICTRGHFQSFHGIFYAAIHSGFEKNCPGGEILQKEEREHKDSGKKKNKNFALQRMISTRKGGGDICW